MDGFLDDNYLDDDSSVYSMLKDEKKKMNDNFDEGSDNDNRKRKYSDLENKKSKKEKKSKKDKKKKHKKLKKKKNKYTDS